MNHFTLLKIQDKNIHFCDQRGTGVVFHVQADRLIRTGLIEFFDPKDAKQIVTVSEIPGSLLTRLAGTSLYVPITRFNYLSILVITFTMAMTFAFPLGLRNVMIGPFKEPAGILLFPLSFIFIDIVNELFGYNIAKRMIRAASIIMAILAIPVQIVLWLKNADSTAVFSSTASSDEIHNSFMVMYSEMPKMMLMISLSMVIADTFNAYLFSLMKSYMCGKALFFRSFISNLFGQIAYTTTWIVIIHFNKLFIMETWFSLFRNLSFKIVYFIAAIPLIYGIRRYIYHQEEKLLKAEMRTA